MGGSETGWARTARSRLSLGADSAITPALVLPLLGAVASEVALYVGWLEVALWGHFLTLFICVAGPLHLADADLLQAFLLLPLFRLVNLGMPVFVELTLLWYPLVYAPLLPAVYLVTRNERLAPLSWRPKLAVLSAPALVVTGALLAEVEYSIIRPEGLIRALTLPELALITAVMVAFVGLVEEVIYRGVLQPVLEQRLGRGAGLLLVSGLFGLMHSAYHAPGELLFAAGIGLLFGALYDATDSLVLVTLLHGLLNVFLFGVIPLRGSALGLV